MEFAECRQRNVDLNFFRTEVTTVLPSPNSILTTRSSSTAFHHLNAQRPTQQNEEDSHYYEPDRWLSCWHCRQHPRMNRTMTVTDRSYKDLDIDGLITEAYQLGQVTKCTWLSFNVKRSLSSSNHYLNWLSSNNYTAILARNRCHENFASDFLKRTKSVLFGGHVGRTHGAKLKYHRTQFASIRLRYVVPWSLEVSSVRPLRFNSHAFTRIIHEQHHP